MPSRKLTDHCPSCGYKNHLRARFCNDCGAKLEDNRARRSNRTKLHADIAHPVNTESRELIQNSIIEEYKNEVERSKQPGYVPTDLGEDSDTDTIHHEPRHSAAPTPQEPSEKPASSGFGEGIV